MNIRPFKTKSEMPHVMIDGKSKRITDSVVGRTSSWSRKLQYVICLYVYTISDICIFLPSLLGLVIGDKNLLSPCITFQKCSVVVENRTQTMWQIIARFVKRLDQSLNNIIAVAVSDKRHDLSINFFSNDKAPRKISRIKACLHKKVGVWFLREKKEVPAQLCNDIGSTILMGVPRVSFKDIATVKKNQKRHQNESRFNSKSRLNANWREKLTLSRLGSSTKGRFWKPRQDSHQMSRQLYRDCWMNGWLKGWRNGLQFPFKRPGLYSREIYHLWHFMTYQLLLETQLTLHTHYTWIKTQKSFILTKLNFFNFV